MKHPLVRRVRGPALALLLLLPIAAGCATRTVPVEPRGQAQAPADLAPVMSIERFLRAANTNDLETMGRLFGTVDGPLLRRDPRAEVEQRMFALASILRHQDYAVVGEEVVPGRIGSAIRIRMQMRFPDRAVIVPFTMVRSQRDGWLVEQIDVNAITSRR
jgi:hypothetical protein